MSNTQIKERHNSYKDLRWCSERGNHQRYSPKQLSGLEKEEKRLFWWSSLLWAGWMALNMLAEFAELSFIPAKESDAGAELSEIEEINNCQLMAREPANTERKVQRTHMSAFSQFCFRRLLEKSKQQSKSGLRNMSLSQQMYFCKATACRCLTTLEALNNTGFPWLVRVEKPIITASCLSGSLQPLRNVSMYPSISAANLNPCGD